MIIKFLHMVGLTNLSDAEIEKYYEIRRISPSNFEKSSLLEKDSEYVVVSGSIILVLAILPLLSKCHGGDISKSQITPPLQDEKKQNQY